MLGRQARLIPLVLLLLLVGTSLNSYAASRPNKRPSVDDNLLALLQKIDHLQLYKRDLAQLREFETRGVDPWTVAARRARYQRVMLLDPVAALETVGPTLIGKKKTGEWQRAFATAKREAMTIHAEQVRSARKEKRDRPEKPDTLFAPFPPFTTWKIDGDTAEAALEAAYACMALNQPDKALAICKPMQGKMNRGVKVLAAECGGDVFVFMARYADALGIYDYALSEIKQEAASSSDGLTGKYLYLQSRIQAKRAEAERLHEIEAYGKGWVLYAQAEKLRRGEKNFGLALIKYDELRNEFDKTVYSEAAKCYSIYCLYELAKPEAEKTLRQVIMQAQKELREAGMQEGQAKAKMEKEAFLAQRVAIRVEIERRRAALEKLEGLVVGKKALVVAEKQTEAFLSENEFGLYRGEIMVFLAERDFWQHLKPEEAFPLYSEAWAWFAKVEQIEATLNNYDVPGKARTVSQPPPVEKERDRWGKITKATIRTGAIVNRRTCTWYLNDLREQCALALGFLHFAREEMPEAKAWYRRLLVLDRMTGRLKEEGQWNNHDRLMWGANHGYLYAYPEERKVYGDRERFIVSLADFYYCTEQFEKARSLTDRFFQGEFGKLSKSKEDYLHFLQASIAMWQEGYESAFDKYAKVMETKENTLTEQRAAFAMGNLAARMKDRARAKTGHLALVSLAKSKQKNEFTYRARLLIGKRLIRAGYGESAEKLFKTIPEEAGGYGQLAEWYLQEFYKKEEAGKAKEEGA
jgi:hypothetical protein